MEWISWMDIWTGMEWISWVDIWTGMKWIIMSMTVGSERMYGQLGKIQRKKLTTCTNIT